jgi:hypothetical protein
MKCANPVCGREAKRKGLCDACYLYARRHKGEMRPEAVIVESGRRSVERDLADPRWAGEALRIANETADWIEKSVSSPVKKSFATSHTS